MIGQRKSEVSYAPIFYNSPAGHPYAGEISRTAAESTAHSFVCTSVRSASPNRVIDLVEP